MAFTFKELVIPTLAFLFLISTLYLFIETTALKTQNNELSKNLSNVINSLTQINDTLIQTKTSLNEKTQFLEETTNKLQLTTSELNYTKNKLIKTEEELKNITSTFQTLEQNYSKLNETVSKLKFELNDLEETINDSVKWFKENSNFSEKFLENDDILSFLSRVKTKCIDGNSINLGCLVFQMEQRLDFKYILEGEDKLYSLNEIVENKGGDCEDFSIFTVALLNYLKSVYSFNGLELISWKEKLGSQFTIDKTDNSYWYISNAEPYPIGGLDDVNPTVICYTVHCAENICEGHCVVGLSEKGLTTTTSLTNLHGSKLFEPQNGQYLGKIDGKYTLCETDILACDKKPNHIWLVIGNDDLYIFKDNVWTSYKYYLTTIEKLKNETLN